LWLRVGGETPRKRTKGMKMMNLGDSNLLEGIHWSDVKRALPIVGSALVLLGMARRSPLAVLLAAVGGGMLYESYRSGTLKQSVSYLKGTPTQQTLAMGQGIRIQESVTVRRSPEDLYRFWRNLENLPRVMNYLDAVHVVSPMRSHWVAKAPAGKTVAWDAEIVTRTENHEILWRSREGSQIANAGSVRFIPTGNRGTEVHVSLSYSPPAGSVGVVIAKIFGEEPHRQIEQDLLRFKQFMETGEFATTEGQPAGHSKKRQFKAMAISSARAAKDLENGSEQDEPKKRNGRGKRRDTTAASQSSDISAWDAPSWEGESA
jgi:uncharacterized membrane protein